MKNKTIITLSIIVLILLVTLGTSVAFFSYASESLKDSSIELGDLTFHYTEIDGVGNGINIEDAEPISDTEGKELDNYFDFKIDANLIQSDLLYEVVVEEIEGSNLPLDIVKFYLTEIVDGEEVELSTNTNNQGEIKTLSEYLDTTKDNIEGKTAYEEKILSNTRNYTKNFRARMWIKDGIELTNYFNETGSFRINVYANTNRSLVDTSIPVPEITGGTGENWVSEAQTIRVVSTTPAVGGIAGYEYYITEDAQEEIDDSVTATGVLGPGENSLLINTNGEKYIYFRIVTSDGRKGGWSNKETVKLDNTKYSVELNVNGGLAEWTDKLYTVDTETFTLPTPTKEGYTFSGWTGSNGETPQTSVSVTKGTTGDKTYTANWEEIKYTVTFNAGTGTVSESSRKVITGNAIGSLPVASKNGYIFSGWYTSSSGGTEITSSTIINSDKTIYAHYVTPSFGTKTSSLENVTLAIGNELSSEIDYNISCYYGTSGSVNTLGTYSNGKCVYPSSAEYAKICISQNGNNLCSSEKQLAVYFVKNGVKYVDFSTTSSCSSLNQYSGYLNFQIACSSSRIGIYTISTYDFTQYGYGYIDWSFASQGCTSGSSCDGGVNLLITSGTHWSNNGTDFNSVTSISLKSNVSYSRKVYGGTINSQYTSANLEIARNSSKVNVNSNIYNIWFQLKD